MGYFKTFATDINIILQTQLYLQEIPDKAFTICYTA
jgi:hypothetical protein